MKAWHAVFGTALLSAGVLGIISLTAVQGVASAGPGPLSLGYILSLIPTVIGIALIANSKESGRGIGGVEMDPKVEARLRKEKSGREASDRIGVLDFSIIKCLSERKSIEEIVKLTTVEPQVVGMKIARLQLDGYITDEGYLTEKGLDAVQKGT